MTADELALELRVDIRTLRRWRRDGMVPKPIRFGRSIRWRRADVGDWLEKRR